METKAKKPLVIPTPQVVTDAFALAGRFRDAQGLQRHVRTRKPLLQGAGAALVLLGLACGAGVFLFLAGLRTWLTSRYAVHRWLNRTMGALFIALGVRLAVGGRR